MSTEIKTNSTPSRVAWNKGRLVRQKRPLDSRPREVRRTRAPRGAVLQCVLSTPKATFRFEAMNGWKAHRSGHCRGIPKTRHLSS